MSAMPPQAGTGPVPRDATAALPRWARNLAESYESNASSQFIIFGNISDRMVLEAAPPARLGSLPDFLLGALLSRFDVVLSYDIGNGIRVEKGAEAFSKWPYFQESQKDWKAPRPAVETLTRYFRYCANLTRINQPSTQVACIIKNADLLVPALQGGLDYDLNALASLIRDWSSESLLADHALASFLLTENLNDLHPLIVNNPRVARVKIALPSPEDLTRAFEFLSPSYPCALREYAGRLPSVAQQLAGSTLGAIETLLKTREHAKQCLAPDDLVKLKKQLVENDCNGLIEFVESKLTLDAIYGQEKVKTWLQIGRASCR